jgi:hypothetical protein
MTINNEIVVRVMRGHCSFVLNTCNISPCIVSYFHSRLELQNRQLLNPKFRCMKYHDEVNIPVKEGVTLDADVFCSDDGSLLLSGIPFHIIRKKVNMPCPRKQELKKVIEEVMRRKGLWEGSLEAEIPVVWEKYGDLLLFNGDRYFKNLAWSEAG